MQSKRTIRRLTVRHFRGLEVFDWNPSAGVNVILGGGDVGKTTVLEAIGLLFSPTNAAVISEADYYRRDSTIEFVIEAVIAFPSANIFEEGIKDQD